MCSSNEALTDHPARFSFTFKLRGFLLWEAGDCLTFINMVRMWIPGSSWGLNFPESLIKSHAYYLYNQKVLTMFEKQLDGQMAQEKRDNGYLSVKARWRFVFLNLNLLYDKQPSTDTPWSRLLKVFCAGLQATVCRQQSTLVLMTFFSRSGTNKNYEVMRIYLKYLSSLPL